MLHEETISSDILRPTLVTVDLNVIKQNYFQILRKAGNRKVMLILKANAYGHGLIRIAKFLENLGAFYFGVAYLEEGVMLRQAGIKTPILVMGGIIGNQIPAFIKYDLTITASSVSKLQQIEEAAIALKTRAKVHLKIDTGMERIGIHYYSAEALLKASLECRATDVEGIFTHFAKADEPNNAYTNLQIERMEKVLSFYKKRGRQRPLFHIANSGGFIQDIDMDCDMVRVGLLLYGVYPHQSFRPLIEVNPALSWKTRIVFFKVVKSGHPISYGGTWEGTEDTRIVTLPVGYGDGYMRSMSNRAHVLIRGVRQAIRGNICMDQLMVDIGPEGTGYNNDEVILIGEQEGLKITVEDLAEWANTIPYEILTNINTRVPRVYLDN